MNEQEFRSMQELADLHVLRITQALQDLKAVFPLDEEKVKSLTKNDIFSIEMLTSRFSKLQDYLGAVVFDALFEVAGENSDSWTMIDKLNKLEKLNLIDDAHIWRNMRKSRNFLTHEYPNQPQIIADSLNIIYNFVPQLLQINKKVFDKMQKDL